MELTQLRYFMEVAKQKNVTKSARILNVVQPAVTQAIGRLEAELGTELFKRGGRSRELTASGRLLYGELLPIMEKLDSLPEKIRAVNRQEGITVRMSILAAWTLVTNAIMEYQRIDHTLTIELSEMEIERPGLADISITTRHSARIAAKNSRDDVRVFREQIFLAVPNIPRYRGRTSISLKDVKDSRFITLSGIKHFRSICDQFCALAGMSPHFVFESDSPASVMNMIAAGMGVGFWPAFSWIRIDPRRILLLEIEKPVCSRDIIISCGEAGQNDTRVRLFYQFLCNYFDVYSRKNQSH